MPHRELRIDNLIPQLIREPRLKILQRPTLPLANLPQRPLKLHNRPSIPLRAQILPRVRPPRTHLQPFPLLRPVRTRVEPHRRILVVGIAHPPVADRLLERFPLAVVLGVRHGQHFDGRRELVAGLRRHEQVAAAHDAQFQRQAHGRVLVAVFPGEGADEALQEGVGGRVGRGGVDEVDHVPPGFLHDGEIRFAVFVGDGNLEFHVSDAHVLDLRWRLENAFFRSR